ncbi:MAG: hypothetical protein AB7I42_25830 [Bradyrhizobium sp.]|uniref:hypothetical protein n=1 Tax=Bradyrhizobium sp. TaxID=376 RepID=UPI003D13C268
MKQSDDDLYHAVAIFIMALGRRLPSQVSTAIAQEMRGTLEQVRRSGGTSVHRLGTGLVAALEEGRDSVHPRS